MAPGATDGALTRKCYFTRASKYLIMEGLVCVCCAALFKNLGPPPWTLQNTSWHDTILRVSVWLNMCHAAAALANGDVAKEFESWKLKVCWGACLLLFCLGQGLAITIPATPIVAKLVLAGTANISLIVVHVWHSFPDGADSIRQCIRYHVEDRLLWIGHAILLVKTTNDLDGASPQGTLSLVLLAQVAWQVIAWIDALQSAPFRRYALVTTATQISHVISVYMTWQAQSLGIGYFSNAVYVFFCLSSVLYEPRVSLPNFGADKTMRVWYGTLFLLMMQLGKFCGCNLFRIICRSKIIHPGLNPVYTTVPLLTALYYTTQVVQEALQGRMPASQVLFPLHVCLSQVRTFFSSFCALRVIIQLASFVQCDLCMKMLLLLVRCLRHHHETKEREVVTPPSSTELWIDAAILAVLKTLLISTLQTPQSNNDPVQT